MNEKSQLIALRTSVARLAQALGVQSPLVADANGNHLNFAELQLTTAEDRGWNTLIAACIEKVAPGAQPSAATAKPESAPLSEDDLAALGYEIMEDSDQPGLYLWRRDQEGSDISFNTKEKAVASASANAMSVYELSRCDNCRKVHSEENLVDPKDLGQRLDPGGTVPSGECPDCGALCYPLKSEQADDTSVWPATDYWAWLDSNKLVALGEHPDFESADARAPANTHWIFSKACLTRFAMELDRELKRPPLAKMADLLERASAPGGIGSHEFSRPGGFRDQVLEVLRDSKDESSAAA